MCSVNATIFSLLIANVHAWIILIIIGMVLAVVLLINGTSAQQVILFTLLLVGIIMELIDFKFITIYASFLTIGTILCLFSVRYCKHASKSFTVLYILILLVLFGLIIR